MILADSNSWNRRQHPRGPAGIIPLREQLTNDRRGNLTLKDLPYFAVFCRVGTSFFRQKPRFAEFNELKV
jgi:hypothetical protein